MRTSSPPQSLPTPPPASIASPVLQVLAAVEGSHPDPVAALHALYKESPDIRATLRLVDPCFVDLLQRTAHSFPSTPLTQRLGAGTRLAPLLSSRALSCNVAAEMLADLVNSDCTMQIPVASVIDNILSGEHRGGFKLLCALAPSSGTGWVAEVVRRVASEIITAPELAQLRLLNFAMVRFRSEAMATLATLDELRRLTRCIIKLLSSPQPLVAAAALHSLTLIVLNTEWPALTALARSLSGKLFDSMHLERTLLLVADLCLNCQAADLTVTKTSDADHQISIDIDVLENTAGVISALAQCRETVNQFVQSTAMVPAISHLLSMARLDHRYLAPLLSITASITGLADEHMETPLLQQLFDTNDDCIIVEDVFEFAMLCVEDAVDLLADSGLRPSNESGSGWFVNSSREMRRSVARSLCVLLGTLTSVRETHRGVLATFDDAMAVVRLLDTVRPYYYLLSSSGNSVAELVESINGYYCVIRPLLELMVQLADASVPRASWEAAFEKQPEIRALFGWAANICEHYSKDTVDSMQGSVLGKRLREDILQTFAPPTQSDADQLANNERVVDAITPSSAATPEGCSPNPQSSSKKTPAAVHNTIGIDDLREASKQVTGAGLGISDLDTNAPESNRLAQVVVLGHWARLCSMEAAALLTELWAKARGLPADPKKPKIHHEANVSSLFDLVSTVTQLHSQYKEHNAVVARLLEQKQTELVDAEDEISDTTGELQAAKTECAELTRNIAEHQDANTALSGENKRLRTTLDAALEQCSCAKKDAGEWKEECQVTRELLEKSELANGELRDSVDRLAKRLEMAERELESNVGMWETKSAEMARSNRELEAALGNAVARLRELEARAELERSVGEELRRQNNAMTVRLNEFSKISETLHNLSRIAPQ
ncbi:hypothetical protein BX070DRAFT_219871 [Coemansia spiralis]|nr:hypothetical protein BX070DRAFT_219871 [Coemansia spiralis]